MGLRVDKIKDRFVFHNSFDNSKTSKLTRSEALLWIRNRFSPYDFIKEYYCFPANWTTKEYDRFPFDDDGNEKYISLLKESMTEDQVFNRYLEIIKELEKESQK
jgi:hypothetical protein